MKMCTGCGETKALDAFTVDTRLRSGRGSRCRTCARAASEDWLKRHPEKHYQYIKAWRQRDPERYRHWARIRYARYKGAEGVVTKRDWDRLLRRYRGCCAYCGAPSVGQDHIIPLSRGGRHSIGNVLPCCRSCNSSKHTRLLAEWRKNELAEQYKR
jgi:5-methylcytosine-specific restriction endonuclease McrA